jgi:hypothetical protein
LRAKTVKADYLTEENRQMKNNYTRILYKRKATRPRPAIVKSRQEPGESGPAADALDRGSKFIADFGAIIGFRRDNFPMPVEHRRRP